MRIINESGGAVVVSRIEFADSVSDFWREIPSHDNDIFRVRPQSGGELKITFRRKGVEKQLDIFYVLPDVAAYCEVVIGVRDEKSTCRYGE